MINTNEGRRFTDDVYATKEQVQAIYNREDVSSVWDKVLLYRQNFSVMTELKDTQGNPYKISLTRKLLADSYTLELGLMEDLIAFIALSPESQNKILLRRKSAALTAVLKFNGSPVPSQDTLDKLSLDQIESIPSDLFVADAYSKAYNQDYLANGLTLAAIETINRSVIGESQDGAVSYRKGVVNDVRNPLTVPPAETIPEHLNGLLAFLGQNEIPAILRALAIPFVFDFLKPFEYFFEGTASIFSKSFLSYSGFHALGYLLDFESIAFSRSKNFFDITKESERTLDLTYFINSILPFIIRDEVLLRSDLMACKKEEEAKKAQPVLSPDGTPSPAVTEEIVPTLALPVFPVSAESAAIEDNAKKLREVYPQLKRKEAHFYAGHCTVGFKYTIDQFRSEEKTVYETARTSMDDLATRGFYKKEKLKNKFVYSPIPLTEDKKQ
jgi:hypothetical protein